MLRTSVWFAVVLGLSASGAAPLRAEEFPSRLITIVVPFAAGSGSDTSTRITAQALGPLLGQTIVVENKVGATGAVAATAVSRAAPDGYTLLVGTNSTHGSNSAIYKTLTYDPLRDFAPVALLGVFTYYLVVNPALPIRSPQELIDYARANPGKLSYATGSSTSLVMAETFAKTTKTPLLKVAYRSNPTALTDVVSGRVSLMFVDISSANAFVKSGQLRAIAVTSRTRSQLAPDLPTVHEALNIDFQIESWTGFLAPARTPKPVIDKLNAAFAKVFAMPEVHDRIVALGVDMQKQSPAEFSAFVAGSVEQFTRLTRDAGIEPQ